MNTKKIIEELKNKIIEQHPDLIGIYLYGSRARSNNNSNGDLDLLLLFPTVTSEKKFDIYGIIGYIEYKFEIFIDIKMLTPSEFKMNPFYYEQVTNFGVYVE